MNGVEWTREVQGEEKINAKTNEMEKCMLCA